VLHRERRRAEALRKNVHTHYEVHPRKDHLDVDLISDALPFGRLWYGERRGKVAIIHDDSGLMRLASSCSVRLVLRLKRSEQMPKYLIQGSYSQQGLKGMLKEGGSKRREAAEQIIKGTGGRLEAYYYAFGSDDFVIIADLPSNVDAAALSFAVNASGAVQSRMTVLITPEEADEATKKMKTVKYRAPGE
jgi:uncharacterized protein with GYD domain